MGVTLPGEDRTPSQLCASGSVSQRYRYVSSFLALFFCDNQVKRSKKTTHDHQQREAQKNILDAQQPSSFSRMEFMDAILQADFFSRAHWGVSGK